MTTNEKIAALRAAAKAAGANGVLIMTSDPHCSEYLPGYYNALPWFSGFIGENSTLVVTLSGSALWCDGRFYVQADKQLAGSEIECMHAGSAGVPTVAEYLENHFGAGDTLLLDGSCVPATIAKEYIDALAKKGASLKSQDVASPIWDATGERPALPDTPCELLTPAQTGATAADRIAMVRAELQKALRKQEAGACGFFTQPVSSDRALANLETARRSLSAKLLGGVMPVLSHRNALFLQNEVSGVYLPDELVARYEGLDKKASHALALELSVQMARRMAPLVDGYYLMTPLGNVRIMEKLIAAIRQG